MRITIEVPPAVMRAMLELPEGIHIASGAPCEITGCTFETTPDGISLACLPLDDADDQPA